MEKQDKLARLGMVALCLGYFLSYIPYTMLTKMATKGLFGGMAEAGYKNGFQSFEIQPVVVLGSFLSMYVFITLIGWWKYATQVKIFSISLPRPQWFTFISGLCTAGQIITTTLAYTYNESIVFMMLLMRGGVLIMAPVVDLMVKKRKRKIYWPSWIAAGLSLGAVIAAFAGKADATVTAAALIDAAIYLFVYFFRFIFMSGWAKSDDESEKKRFFVEEQLVANPLLFFSLLTVGFIGSGMGANSIPGQLWTGISTIPFSGYFWPLFFAGVFSYGAGLFGTLIYLDKRENTFCVPANRVSSVIAGVIATYWLWKFYYQRGVAPYEWIGVGIVSVAIIFLVYRSVAEKKQLRRNCN